MTCKDCPRAVREFNLNDFVPEEPPIWMYSCPFEDFVYLMQDTVCFHN